MTSNLTYAIFATLIFCVLPSIGMADRVKPQFFNSKDEISLDGKFLGTIINSNVELIAFSESTTHCCSLGELAADKGFHCNPKFYRMAVLARNVNRPHNKKLPFHGEDRIEHFGQREMIRFESCSRDPVSAKSFYKCCFHASLEEKIDQIPRYEWLQTFTNAVKGWYG